MALTNQRILTCLFCEDIRQETNGQASLIGVFPRAIGVPQMPIVFPKLGLYVQVYFPYGAVPSQLRLKLLGPWAEEPLLERPITGIREMAESARKLEVPGLGFSMPINSIFSPFQIMGAGDLRLIVSIDGEDIYAGGLAVSVAPALAGKETRQ